MLLPVAYKNVTRIEQLSIIANDKPIMIHFSDILYWKQEGECRKEVEIREPNAIVAPRRVEEREVDTRCIVLFTKTKQIKFSYSSMQVFEDLIPQYQYERVLFQRKRGIIFRILKCWTETLLSHCVCIDLAVFLCYSYIRKDWR